MRRARVAIARPLLPVSGWPCVCVCKGFKDGRRGGACVLCVPAALRCQPLHDRVRHLQGLVPRRVRTWGTNDGSQGNGEGAGAPEWVI
ncbi:hypothetical protein NDU88_007032 [Pleurodeles waltl]|uniref:Secreted protein n=1 Tax=Pleurodeles waltl TaxID=8319 RepID=A0AAV7SR88_PLEWA|nr:hypothetical protein NDU88_007032 [Pleurodeles waltl]